METIDISDRSRAVNALSDNDLVMACGSGLSPITFANLKGQTMETFRHVTKLSVKEGDWVRIAETPNENASFMGLISLTHPWGSGKPVPTFILVAGSSANVDSFSATTINDENTRLTTTTSHNVISFPSIRFVKDGKIYVEVKFAKTSASYIFTALSNACYLSLTEATISSATADKVLQTIDFLRGGVIGYLPITYTIGEKGGLHADEGNLGGAEGGLDGYVGFGTLDSMCRFLGKSCEINTSESCECLNGVSLESSQNRNGYRRCDDSGDFLSERRQCIRDISDNAGRCLRTLNCSEAVNIFSTCFNQQKRNGITLQKQFGSLARLEDSAVLINEGKEVTYAD